MRPPTRSSRARSRVRELCLALGFTEAMHYSFLSRKELDDFEEVVAALEEANAEAEKPGYKESLIPFDVMMKEMREIANGIRP